MLKEHYVFHKKSIKALKGKKYKAWRGANDQLPEIVLPEAYHVDHFEKAMKKVKDLAKQLNPNAAAAPGEVKMPTLKVQDDIKKEEQKGETEKESNIIIPGITKND